MSAPFAAGKINNVYFNVTFITLKRSSTDQFSNNTEVTVTLLMTAYQPPDSRLIHLFLQHTPAAVVPS